MFARIFLQWQSNKITKVTLWKTILGWNKAVICFEWKFMVRVHSVGYKTTAKFTRNIYRNILRKENPKMNALAGARAFYCHADIQLGVYFTNSGTITPQFGRGIHLRIKIEGKEAARFIGEHGIYTNSQFPF